jgi:hypothetical protein
MNMISEYLTGKIALGFSIDENKLCSLELSDGFALSIDCLCRYVGADGSFITSEDHGHIFGLPSAYDAAGQIKKKIMGGRIKDVVLRPETGDVTIFFPGGLLELICVSAGYEAYQLNGPNNLLIVGRGGKE